MSRGRHVESRADRRVRARALAGFFAAGAVLSTLVLVLPGWESIHRGGLAGTVVAAATGAAGLYLFADRLSRGMIHLATTSGTVLIAACQVFARGGSPTAMYAMLYIWVILHCSLFFSRAVVAAHLTATTVAHALALVWLDDVASLAPQIALTLVTQVSAALVVGSLAVRQREMADTDSLTGLGNRRVAERALEAALDRSRRVPASPSCVALLDLDGFKAFNDRRGHAAGDLVLIEVAATWRELVRGTDVLARTGGDEFVLVLGACDVRQAEAIVRRLVARTPVEVTCSAGLARWLPGDTPTTLLERADVALYAAKTEGPIVLAPEIVEELAPRAG